MKKEIISIYNNNTLVFIKTYLPFFGIKLFYKEYLYSFSTKNKQIYRYYNWNGKNNPNFKEIKNKKLINKLKILFNH